ncbi:XdhC family protein [Pararhizobium sp. BT-229]|uniref:XdhC family protein n=1 Tax=Pararhizobium sp. BT-229 TaxID=2986923 RepID=UPI0021F7F1AE|nr:XdhC family protein [Pararhizobium sp. BT-229]MCV9967027.1 XdhC family protein [Pararhizobium sp. BT-229]
MDRHDERHAARDGGEPLKEHRGVEQFETGITARGLFESEGISVSGSSRRSIVPNARSIHDVIPAVTFCAIMTDDPEAILNYAAERFEKDGKTALVTLVDIRGGSARALGAQMAVGIDGGYCGYVSGDCTEAAVAAEAIDAIAKGTDRFLLLGEGPAFFDVQLPCGGGITLAIHVLKDAGPLRHVLARLRSRQMGALCYNAVKQTITAAEDADNSASYIRRYRPRPRLVMFGRGIELDCTTTVARHSGFETFAFDGQSGQVFDETLIDADTAIALLFHDLDQELPFLKIALHHNPFYIGALGSKRTHERRREALRKFGHADHDIDRISAPIGVFGPVRDGNLLAQSILADIGAARAIMKFDGDV